MVPWRHASIINDIETSGRGVVRVDREAPRDLGGDTELSAAGDPAQIYWMGQGYTFFIIIFSNVREVYYIHLI